MAKQKKRSFEDAVAGIQDSSEGSRERPTRRRNQVATRVKYIDQNKDRVASLQFRVDPDKCRLWERHNRDYARLDSQRCSDLIESFQATGKQDFPAIVRELPDGDSHQYEIITGARRFWTVNYLREHGHPNFQYYIEVRKLTDQQAFLLSHDENFARRDISAYERGRDFAQACETYFGGNQADLARSLNKSESWVSRYLSLANLPKQIIDAYPDWDDIPLRHASDLSGLVEMKDSSAKNRVISEATRLYEEHQNRRNTGSAPMSAADVLRRLKSAAAGSAADSRPATVASYGPPSAPYLTLKSDTRNSLNFVVPKDSGADISDIVDAFREALESRLTSQS